MTRNSAVSSAGALLLTVAVLLPIGDAPWFSFWREWTAAGAMLLIVIAALKTLRDKGIGLQIAPMSLITLSLGLAALCWAQWIAGLIPYLQDAWLPSAYAAGFATCVMVARSLPPDEREALADRIAWAFLIASLVSAGMAFLQWIGWLRLDMGMRPAGGRPVAHMEQANMLCSLAIQGAVGAWRLVERQRIKTFTCLAALVPIAATMVLTQSRVAWLVPIVLVCVLLWRRDLDPGRVRVKIAGLVALLIVVSSFALPTVDHLLGLPGAALVDRVSAGRRPDAWLLFMHAAVERPWFGWGVMQNGVAQYAEALDHPSLGYVFASAHNIFLDWLIWFGIPAGTLAAASIVVAIARRMSRASDIATVATIFATVALLVHALVEFPWQFLFFLWPMGLQLGASTPPDKVGRTLNCSQRWLVPSITLLVGALLAWVGIEYIRVTDVRPVQRYDITLRHRLLTSDLPVPDVVLLDQLRAFHAYVSIPLKSGQSAEELDAARTAVRRQPYAISLERFAKLAAFNGRPQEARDALARICQFEASKACAESERVWDEWRRQWPELPPWTMPTP